ncbi:extracellular solute-binding protein [Paenibacillus agaridevorans]|uniref:extracellular solute-binding protein n=1 Tax=Paenibacillus agaridevorans TaxID=171404 RepID=UPI001BE47D71|nr:extracellular solute-binding protein [Paenibacillus agaridevorans]
MIVNKRVSLSLCVIMLLSVIMGACTKGDSGGSASPTESSSQTQPNSSKPATEENQEPITLTLISWGAGNAELFAPLYAEFTKKYPWITVNEIGSGGLDNEGLSKLAALQSSGTTPDLVWPAGLAAWEEGGNLEDLKPYIDSDPILPTLGLREGFLQKWEQGGKIYTVPWTDDSLPIIINKNLLAKHGLEMPSEDWTYDDFRELAKKATKPESGEYGLSYSSIFKLTFPYLLSVANGNADRLLFMNEDNTQSLANTPGVLEDLKWMQDMYAVDKVMMDAATFEAGGYGGEQGDFLAGKALMGIAFPIGQLDELVDFEWDLVPLPRGKVSQPSFSNASPLSMLSVSKNKDAAWKFIRFQYEYEANKWRVNELNPSMMASEELDQLLQSNLTGKNVQALKTSSCCAGDAPVIFDYQNLAGPILTTSLVEMLNNNGDINGMIPAIEDYNRRAAEFWKSKGIMQ